MPSKKIGMLFTFLDSVLLPQLLNGLYGEGGDGMSKYIVEIKPEYEDSFKGVMILGAKDNDLFVDVLAVDDLELLNSDYINEHFGSLQDTAYQKGFEDGKAVLEKGCEGCKWEDKDYNTCSICCNSYKNMYEAKKADDEIKVGDEVEDHTDSLYKKAAVWSIKGDVLRVIAVGGETWMLRKNNAVRTGRHFNIDKILEEMKG